MNLTSLTPVLVTSDIGRAEAFYRDLLGFQVGERLPPKGDAFRVRMHAGAVELAIERASSPRNQPTEAGIVLSFGTDDVLALYDALRAKATGVSVPLFTPIGTMALSLADPDVRELSFEQPVATLHMTKDRLVGLIRDSHAQLQSVIGRLSDEQMTVPQVQGQWSAKDILAHISAWEEHCLGFLDADARGETPQLITSADVDRVNEQFYQESRGKALEEVRSRFSRAYQAMLDRLESLTEQDLVSPERYPWFRGSPFWLMVAYNTFDHYPRHEARIRRWLGNAAGTAT